MVMKDARLAIVEWARWGVENNRHFNYSETRPMPLTDRLPITTDCSGFVTLCYFLAGAPDPNGLGFNGSGYTGTLLSHGRHIKKSQLHPGDLIVYGPGSGWHTALIVEQGLDPLTISHGEQGDPSYVRVSQDGREPQTFLRFPTRTRHPVFPRSERSHPNSHDLYLSGLVALHNANEAWMAKNNGWELYIWDGFKFLPSPSTLPRDTIQYATRDFAKKR